MTSARAVPILALVLAAGCAPLQWDKPGGDVASLESDLLACRQSAHLSLAGEPFLGSRARPGIAGDGLHTMQSWPEMDSERPLREFQATQNCMREKGYQLKPAPAR